MMNAGLNHELTRRALLRSVRSTLAARHERDAALATIRRVRALHVMSHVRDTKWCQQDQRSWPCPTIVALKEQSS